ncbi:MAG: P-II family nitrogen regulator [Clostridiales bacterium]|nr:P-II family nitrogen regulator [Clostridiales bacterium]
MISAKDNLILFSCILDFGKGSKALELSKVLGGKMGTIFLGRGTVRAEWLNVLGALDVRKEIFITIIDEESEDIFYKRMADKFNLNKKRHGIAFSMPIGHFYNRSNLKKEGENKVAYECIFTIVDKGLSGDVLEAAEAAGSTGGTVIHGRGTGTREKATLFNIKIEPEKEIVLILAKTENTDSIVDSIEKKLNIKEPGTGIIFVMDVSRTLGLYQG